MIIGPPGAAELVPTDEAIDERLRAAMAKVSLKEAVAQVAAETGQPRRKVYARALELTRDDP